MCRSGRPHWARPLLPPCAAPARQYWQRWCGSDSAAQQRVPRRNVPHGGPIPAAHRQPASTPVSSRRVKASGAFRRQCTAGPPECLRPAARLFQDRSSDNPLWMRARRSQSWKDPGPGPEPHTMKQPALCSGSHPPARTAPVAASWAAPLP